MARLKRVGASSHHPTPPDGGSAERGGEATPWFRVSGWRLRNKIALALAFPVISAAWFATDKAIESFIVQQSHEATAGQVRVLEPALDFLYAAENSYVQTLRTAPGSAERREAAKAVETTAEALTKASSSDALTENQRVQIKNIVQWADDLTDTRIERVATATNSQVSQLNSAVSDYFQTIVNGQVVPEASLQQINHVMDGHIALTQQRIYTDYDGETIKNQPDLLQYIGIERGAIESLADARPAGDPDATNLRSQNVQRQASVVLGRGELRFGPALELYTAINASVLEESLAALDKNAQDAQAKALLNLYILVASILATLVFAWLIARLILNPVRSVRDGALAVANEQLPRAVAEIRAGREPDAFQPINVHTQEEMGQLARAVDDLHRTAVNLASGEAKLRTQVGEMFVTLSRRNTSLINQQLGLIEELERDEQDPRRLENLFRLDHLAARMRRTAESLVILSDAPVRQRDSSPLSITDALQAATAGVQEYQRVELRGGTQAQVDGAVANDLVHLLTELIDNALSFSPPTAPVQVSTSADPTGLRIEISDGGLGMPADMLSQLNTMLAAEVGISPDAARRMGLFVVSRLAQRHQLEVRLVQNSRGGVTASVALPGHLVVGGVPAQELPATPEIPASPATAYQPPAMPAPAVSSPVMPAPAIPSSAPVPAPAVPLAPVAPTATPPAVPTPAVPTPAVPSKPSPLSDPLNDPLPAAFHQAPAPAASPAVGPDEGSAPDLLPKRRPGATVPTRVAAVSPTGDSLFGGSGGQKSSGGLFDRPAPEPIAEAPVEPVAEPTAPEVPAAVVDPLTAPLDPAPLDSVSPENIQEAAVASDAAPAPELIEQTPVEPEVDDMPAPPVAFPSLPPMDADVPVTPATSDSTVSMFGTPGKDTRKAPERTEADNATVAARMGMFNALARGGRGSSSTRAAAEDEVPAPVSSALDAPSPLDGPSVLDRITTAEPSAPSPGIAEPLTASPAEPEPVADLAAPVAEPESSAEPENEAAGVPEAAPEPISDPIATDEPVQVPAQEPVQEAVGTSPGAEPVESPEDVAPLVPEPPVPAVDTALSGAPSAPPIPSQSGTPATDEKTGWLGNNASTSFSSSGADAGWAAAEKVAKHVETETTGAGLPQRRPGQRLVPGAVAATKALPPRDPEAIRRRLASHAAGVSRGRSATVTPTPRAQEEGQA